MPSYRKIFPSYDWDRDVVYVNQIINYSHIVGASNAGFIKNVPNEEIKSSDSSIARWIRENMSGCSSFVLFVGEKTYLSRWCLYEMRLARELGLGRMVIYLTGMKSPSGVICGSGPDPYFYDKGFRWYHEGNYLIKRYVWTMFPNPYQLLGDWIEDACVRAGR
jgi:hypothetical protein